MALDHFLFQCLSEGLITKGLRAKFNLADCVNDEDLVNKIQDELNIRSSRITDELHDHYVKQIPKIEEALENVKEEVFNMMEPDEATDFIQTVKLEQETKIAAKVESLRWKLRSLPQEKRLETAQGPQFDPSQGSRQITDRRYLRDKRSEATGAPFPTNLRRHRRRRPSGIIPTKPLMVILQHRLILKRETL